MALLQTQLWTGNGEWSRCENNGATLFYSQDAPCREGPVWHHQEWSLGPGTHSCPGGAGAQMWDIQCRQARSLETKVPMGGGGNLTREIASGMFRDRHLVAAQGGVQSREAQNWRKGEDSWPKARGQGSCPWEVCSEDLWPQASP